MARRASSSSKRALGEYRRKRDFRKTAEPAGRSSKLRKGSRFVVQKHAASHLHFDFRLEHDGVLKSWAVPKGPSADPAVRRLAVQVEDHPLDYYDFEGIIPEGEYGGGTVMVWDVGQWTPIGDANEGLRRGRVKMTLNGKRLRGNWSLTRMQTESGSSSKPQWLLRKDDDRYARHATTNDDSAGLITRFRTSVLTRKTMEQIARTGKVHGQPSNASKGSANGAPRAVRLRSKPVRPAPAKRSAQTTLSNPGRLVFPDIAFSKQDLAQYYFDIAKWMLPHIAGRPISLLRCPEGEGKPCFFQKHPHNGGSPAIRTVRIKEKSGSDDYLVIDDVEGLLWAVQMGAMELHPWGSRAESLELADYLVFDLDPGPRVTWKAVTAAARLLRDELRKVDLQAFVRTSGGKGLHVVTPLMPGVDWNSAKQLAKTIAAVVAAREPNKYVTVMTKSKRTGRIFIDYLRNGRGATAIANYSTRARIGGPVATPLRWSELASIKSGSQFTVTNVKQRLAQLREDPWKDFRLPVQ